MRQPPGILTRRFVLIAACGVFAFVAVCNVEAAPSSSDAGKLATAILDDSRPAEIRQKEAADDTIDAAAVIEAMTGGLEAQSNLKEEYRRIPWIWRVAIAAGKRNREDELLRILRASLPAKGAKLRDWQAVVIGGGIINGISLVGGWPGERLSSIVTRDEDLKARWEWIQDQASTMADDPAVFKGTRYDALRILGVGTWDRRGAQIFRYLLRGVDEELQMGAISAFSDIRSPCIGQALLSGITFYSSRNREMTLDALLREDSRVLELVLAVEDGRLTSAQIGEARIARMKKVRDTDVRARVEKTLGNE